MSEPDTISNWLREDWPLWLATVAVLGATALAYPSLPQEIPIHWNLYGEADGYAAKFWGAWLLPAIGLATYLSLVAGLHVLPRTEKLREDGVVLQVVRVSGPFFLLALQAVILASWLGLQLSILDVVYVAVGALYVLLGNFLPRVKPNWLFGIRVPWTLESDEVWYRTHRLAGPIWVVGGLSLLLTPLVPTAVGKSVYFFAVTGALILVPVVSSYRWYRSLEAS